MSSPARTFSKINKLVLSELKPHKKHKIWQETCGSVPKSLGLLICSDSEIREYNKSYRKLDKATDVLSFPSLELAQGNDHNVVDSYMGDMVISLETVQRAAKRHRRAVDDELVEVFVHGVLHLLGFDHVKVKKADAQEMRNVQRILFKKAKKLITMGHGRIVKES